MRTTILSGDRHSAQLTTAELNQIIDLDRYPLHQLDSTKGQALVTQCQRDLDAHAASALNNFIRPDAVERLTKEAEALTPSSYRFTGKPRQTYPDADPTSEQDPIAQSVRGMKHANSNNQVLNYQIPNNSDLRVMFLWPQLCEFVRRVRRVETLYTSQCPHLGLTMKVAFEGDNDGWHYDPNDGVVTLLLQSPDEGGDLNMPPTSAAKQMKIMRGSNGFLTIPTKPAFVFHRTLGLSHFSMAGTRCIEFDLWGRP